MANNGIFRDVDMIGSNVALTTETRELFSGDIGASTDNTSNIILTNLQDGGATKTMVPGEYYKVTNIDLARLLANGAVGDRIDLGGSNV